LNSILSIAFIIISSWLLILSLLFYWFVLKKATTKRPLSDSQVQKNIEDLLETQKIIKTKLNALWGSVAQLEGRSSRFVQKMGFNRFNPFSETGGDQSFSVALMDGDNNGFVITSLHTRNGTRTYAKPIMSGKSEHGFSKEEQKVIELAKNYETK